jgi:SAM-dependent methyltransferase
MASPCPVCGVTKLAYHPILWTDLIKAWGLTEVEANYIDRQQGEYCVGCGCNMRVRALATALRYELAISSYTPLATAIANLGPIDLLEVNTVDCLGPYLAKIPGHVRGSWPAVDLRALPYASDSFDLVIHSDTLEHIDFHGTDVGFEVALHECRRVLRPSGALIFTVPTLVGKLTRSTVGRTPSYHDPTVPPDESLRVHTEFGADVWAYVLAAGFRRVEFTCIEFPAGLAITAWK